MHQASVLSPNDVRFEEGWPRSNNLTADSIEPPAAERPRLGYGSFALRVTAPMPNIRLSASIDRN